MKMIQKNALVWYRKGKRELTVKYKINLCELKGI